MARLPRLDYVGRIDLVAAPTAPTPGHAPTIETPEGYLITDALIARDGILQYSDGRSKWDEYRPRVELEAAAASFAHKPLTDDHPPQMVTSETWSEVAKGIMVGAPTIEVHDGTTYLRARLMFTDADLIQKIKDGQRELSIGFTSEVIPTTDGVAEDGTRCDAVQTAMLGNHTASVGKGRAGPTCRVLMDGAAWTITTEHDAMKTRATPAAPGTKVQPGGSAAAGARTDNIGMPMEQMPYQLASGQTIELPTEIVAMLEELAQLKAQMAQPMEEAAAAPTVQPQLPAPVSPTLRVPAAAAADQLPPSPEDKDKDKEQMDSKIDSLNARFERRRRLDRIAVRVGLPEDKLDTAATDDEANDALAREIVETRMPWAKEDAASLKGDALDALVSAAAKMPKPEAAQPRGDSGTINVNPFEVQANRVHKADAYDPLLAKFLQRQGF